MKQFEGGVQPNQLHVVSEGTADTQNTLTIPARSGHFPVLDHFTFSCDDDPGKGTLVTITIGSTVVWKHFVKYAGPGPIRLHGLCTGTKGEAATIVASAAGTGITVNLSVAYR